MEHFPLIPVEEEGRLNDPILREMFIGRVFTLRRFRDLLAQGKTRGGLVSFHTDHKLLLLSHDRKRYSEMGRLVAAAKELTPSDLYGGAVREAHGEKERRRASPHDGSLQEGTLR
jgi:uncharacterized protein YbgA (DUF1722 family)